VNAGRLDPLDSSFSCPKLLILYTTLSNIHIQLCNPAWNALMVTLTALGGRGAARGIIT
jgi:hypothetical protein